MANLERIQAINNELDECIAKANNLPDVDIPELQSKTITPTKSTQSVTPDSGYDGLSTVTVNPIPGEYIIPSGTMDITENGTYDVTQKSNVTVNVESSGGGNYTIADIVEKKISGDIVLTQTSIPTYCFYDQRKITSISAPNVTNVEQWGCAYLVGMTNMNFPELTQIKASAFRNCHGLTTIVLPKVTKVLGYGLYYSINAVTIDLPVCTQIATYAFGYSYKLEHLILRSETVCVLDNVNAFVNSPMQAGKAGGYVYVPSALLSQYQTATNWSALAVTFRAIEDYPDICG